MPCSSLVLSKFHGLKNSSTNKNAKLDAEAVPILSLDVGLFEEGKVCKVLTSGADNVIRIWQFDSSRCSVSHVKRSFCTVREFSRFNLSIAIPYKNFSPPLIYPN